MLSFHRILFPVDFSEATVAMVPYVAEVAQRFGGIVTVLNAFDLIHDYNMAERLGPFDSERVSIPYTDAMQEIRTERQTRLEEFPARTFRASPIRQGWKTETLRWSLNGSHNARTPASL